MTLLLAPFSDMRGGLVQHNIGALGGEGPGLILELGAGYWRVHGSPLQTLSLPGSNAYPIRSETLTLRGEAVRSVYGDGSCFSC